MVGRKVNWKVNWKFWRSKCAYANRLPWVHEVQWRIVRELDGMMDVSVLRVVSLKGSSVNNQIK
jgi:hypothetical protein